MKRFFRIATFFSLAVLFLSCSRESRHFRGGSDVIRMTVSSINGTGTKSTKTDELIGTVDMDVLDGDTLLSVTRDGFGGFQNYTWIEGWSEKDGSAGQWSVRVSPHDTDVLVTSDWRAENGRLLSCRNTYNLSHAMGSIGAFFNGSYVEYSASATDERFNNSLKISYFQIGDHEVGLNLEWNPETNAFRSCMNGGKWVE